MSEASNVKRGKWGGRILTPDGVLTATWVEGRPPLLGIGPKPVTIVRIMRANCIENNSLVPATEMMVKGKEAIRALRDVLNEALAEGPDDAETPGD